MAIFSNTIPRYRFDGFHRFLQPICGMPHLQAPNSYVFGPFSHPQLSQIFFFEIMCLNIASAVMTLRLSKKLDSRFPGLNTGKLECIYIYYIQGPGVGGVGFQLLV